MFNMEEHVMEGVTYEIVDVVDATYARLANADDEPHAADVEYLELDMEVVEAVSDAAEYFSNADDSQEDEQEEEHEIVKQPSQKVQQLINVNGNQCFSIKEEKNLANGNDEKRKRKASDEASFTDNSLYINKACDIEKSKEQIKTSECDSLDLFFQSMAQTVLHLPSRVQAKIKMDICQVIAMAEIKYCSVTANNNNSNNNNNHNNNSSTSN